MRRLQNVKSNRILNRNSVSKSDISKVLVPNFSRVFFLTPPTSAVFFFFLRLFLVTRQNATCPLQVTMARSISQTKVPFKKGLTLQARSPSSARLFTLLPLACGATRCCPSRQYAVAASRFCTLCLYHRPSRQRRDCGSHGPRDFYTSHSSHDLKKLGCTQGLECSRRHPIPSSLLCIDVMFELAD